MGVLQIKRDDPEWNRYRKVHHAGSYNANAVSAAAGNAVLEMAATGAPQKKAEALMSRLCKGINDAASDRGVDIRASQMCSAICLTTQKFSEAFNTHMLLNGVHMHRGVIGWASAVHTERDIDQTVEAFGLSLDGLTEEGVL
jgi:glutamate-1-semialdehyde 2,1-aminomutase